MVVVRSAVYPIAGATGIISTVSPVPDTVATVGSLLVHVTFWFAPLGDMLAFNGFVSEPFMVSVELSKAKLVTVNGFTVTLQIAVLPLVVVAIIVAVLGTVTIVAGVIVQVMPLGSIDAIKELLVCHVIV